MANHFKLEITNRSVRITMFNNVSENFSEEYAQALSGEKYDDNVDMDLDKMNWAMRSVFEPVNIESPAPDPAPQAETKKSPKQFQGKYAVYNYNKRLKSRVAKIRSKAYINFKVPNVQFVTLTFDPRLFPNATDLDACHAEFKKFIQRLHYVLDDFIYIATFSRQKNNNWHYHMLCNLDINVKNKLIQDKWRLGLTTSTPLTSYTEFDSRIAYCIENMYAIAWEDLRGEKGYLSSLRLQKPIVFRSWKEDEVDSAYEYMSKILESTDKPLDVSSETVKDALTDNEVIITRKVSHKVFPELFAGTRVAKLKQKKR